MEPDAQAATGWTHTASVRPMRVSSRVLARSLGETMRAFPQEFDQVCPIERRGVSTTWPSRKSAGSRHLVALVKTFGSSPLGADSTPVCSARDAVATPAHPLAGRLDSITRQR